VSGYRQSSFDPDAYQAMGRPLRPFNWVQWTGVALVTVGLLLGSIDIAGELGWIGRLFDGDPPTFLLTILGLVLLNSRREPPADVTPEQRAANRRLLSITAALCALALGLAVAIDLLGA
jgi:hypothetical protein